MAHRPAGRGIVLTSVCVPLALYLVWTRGRSTPGYAEAHNNLGNALAGRGPTDEAITHYRRALAIRPEMAAARRNLAAVLAQQPQRATKQ
jgi:tetratricopeptide (TPR) repeat protein